MMRRLVGPEHSILGLQVAVAVDDLSLHYDQTDGFMDSIGWPWRNKWC